MLKRVNFSIPGLLILLLVLSSCGKFRKIEKSDDWRVKYEAALNYYEDEDYYRAAILFEQILPIVRGLPEGQKVQFYYAYTQYHQRMYLLSAHHFQQFYQTYGRSELAEEARYMEAYALYTESPSHNLDQTSSIQALTAMQNFLNLYPQSKFRDNAVEVIYEIQEKLEKKAFENAKQYHKLRRYKAAVVAFDNFRNNYPDSEYNEEAAYLKFDAQYQLAKQSIPGKQLERFREAAEFYRNFIDTYPNSNLLKEAEKKYSESIEQISQLAKN
ncbi:MAG: outer membrane protein assembly factor BamD [Candidatus Cyclobacteriaceae bacterium M2_1C_046]